MHSYLAYLSLYIPLCMDKAERERGMLVDAECGFHITDDAHTSKAFCD